MRAFFVCLIKLISGLPGRLYRWGAGSVITDCARLLEKLNYKQAALRLYGAAIRLAPACWRNYYLRAKFLYLGLDRILEALEDVEAAFSLKQNSVDLYELRAAIYIDQDEFKKAMADLTKIEQHWPGRPDTRVLRGLCLQALKRPESALTDLEADLQRNPVRLESLRGKAQCLNTLERYKEALETSNWGLKLAPTDEELLDCSVTALLALGKPGEALQLANRLVTASRCAASAYSLRAEALEDDGQLQRALKDRQQTVKLDSKQAGYWNRLGILYGRMDNPRAAAKCLSRAVKLDPEGPALHFNRGMALEESGDLLGALGEFDAALRLDNSDPDYYYFRARALLEMDRPDDSARDLDLAIKMTAEDPHYFYLRGKVYEKKQDLTKALADYNRAIELDPKCGPAYERRGAVYFDLGEKAKAREDSLKARHLK